MDLYRFAVIFIVLPILGGHGDTSLPKMIACLQQILPGKNIEDVASQPLPIWEIRKLKQVCSDQPTFDACMDTIPKNIDAPLEEMKMIVQKKIDFLCGAGRNYYIRHKSCLDKNAVNEKVAKCSTDFVAKYNPKKQTNSTKCGVITEFRDCVQNAAHICGSEAKKLVATYMDFNVEPYTGTPDCPLDASGASTTHFTILNLMLPAVALWLRTL